MPPDVRPQVLSRVLMLLDADRLRVLEILLIFLRELANHSEKTLMNAHNLAIVFAPNILRSGSDNPGQVITDAKATLEIVFLLLTDTSIVSGQAPEEKPPAETAEFKRTMQENYEAMRKDSSRKLEQVSRKSRVSQIEFNKKMEQLSQKILDGEIDATIFDQAAGIYMDPALIAQFGGAGNNQSARAARHQRNAQRQGVFVSTSAANGETALPLNSPPSSTLTDEEESLLSTTSNSARRDSNSSFGTDSLDSTTDLHSDAGAANASTTDTASTSSMSMRRTKPSLARSHTTGSNTNPVELGLQRQRSGHLTNSSSAKAAIGRLGNHRTDTFSISTPPEESPSSTPTNDGALSPRPEATSPTPEKDILSPASPIPINPDEEDLDVIMGDLLGPYSPVSPRHASMDDAPSSTKSLGPSSSAGSVEAEAAALVTLELLELMLGVEGEVEPASQDIVEEETATQNFPTTGLFSSPLTVTSSRRATVSRPLDMESLPSLGEINEVLNGN